MSVSCVTHECRQSVMSDGDSKREKFKNIARLNIQSSVFIVPKIDILSLLHSEELGINILKKICD